MPQSSHRLRKRRNGLCGCLKVFVFFGLHVRSRTYGHACMATHVRARESEGTACVFVSGSWFDRFLFFGLHVRARMYGHARTGKHVWPRTYGHARAKERPVWLLFLERGWKVFIFFCTYGHARTGTHARARTYGHVLVYL